ncbi:MAG: DNA gyrase/topoisomerase IV subunit A, partial [Muribaculaceae bacterium]|nr:DNA gyrase/topoisomerase IV subunit A [Muribaculaceae bacterium]
HLAPGTSSDKAIDALYAFTDCEVSISPNCCVIRDNKPQFLNVTELLKYSVERTKSLLLRELEIKLGENREVMLFASLEKIFIEQRMYKDEQIENAPDMQAAIARLDMLFEPYKSQFYRELTTEDLTKLWEIRMGRILKFNSEKAERRIEALASDIEQIEYDIDHLTEYTINWYVHLKEKYGEKYPRRTTLRGFDSIEATKVAEANKRLCWDKTGGFVGTGLKEGNFQFTCSDIDEILIIYNDGKYKVVKVQDKLYIGKKVKYIGLFNKGDKRTIYNIVYRNGSDGFYYKKRCFITGLAREKEYDLTKGLPGSRIAYLSVNPNGEAEVVKVTLADKKDKEGRTPRVLEFTFDFADMAIKNKDSLGNLVTKYDVESIKLEKRGASTLGGREVWFDRDVLRLNYDGRGESLGVFQGDDLVLVLTNNGEYFTSSFAESNHYDDNIMRIEKYDPHKVWTLALYDASLGFPYLKRFVFEPSSKPQRYVGNDEQSRLLLLTDTPYPRLQLTFAGNDSVRPEVVVDAEEFIGVKSVKAKGKRLTTFDLGEIVELEPTRHPEPPADPTEDNDEVENGDVDKSNNDNGGENDVTSGPMVIDRGLFEFESQQ